MKDIFKSTDELIEGYKTSWKYGGQVRKMKRTELEGLLITLKAWEKYINEYIEEGIISGSSRLVDLEIYVRKIEEALGFKDSKTKDDVE